MFRISANAGLLGCFVNRAVVTRHLSVSCWTACTSRGPVPNIRLSRSILEPFSSPEQRALGSASTLVYRRPFSRRDGGTSGDKEFEDKRKATVMFISAVGILVLSLSYAAVPLYRLFCQAYSYGGTVLEKADGSDLATMKKRADRKIRISFNADTAASMRWNFKPQQTEVIVSPGETALAFYTAKNNTSEPIDGIATYNVIPFEVGQYFNKIQCFCFEEQRLNPGEEVDMPVFFYIDPEFAEDPKMEYIDDVTLSYTFFEAKEGLKLPMPSFITKS